MWDPLYISHPLLSFKGTTARIRQSGQDSQCRKARAGQPGGDSQGGTARGGQKGNGTARTEYIGRRGKQNKTAMTGLPGQGDLDRAATTGLLG